jgi:hypothetical protein
MSPQVIVCFGYHYGRLRVQRRSLRSPVIIVSLGDEHYTRSLPKFFKYLYQYEMRYNYNLSTP